MDAVGIDIGASKIVFAWLKREDSKNVEDSKIVEDSKSTPFCVAFNDKERLFGHAAEAQFPVNPKNTIHGRGKKFNKKIYYLILYKFFFCKYFRCHPAIRIAKREFGSG